MNKILDQYRALEKEKRGGYNYNNQSWHCVNVKRRNDYIKPEDIEKEAKRLTKNKNILPSLIEYGKEHSQDDGLYYQWLGYAGEMLKEDIDHSGLLSLKHIVQQGTREELDYKSRCNTCRRLTWYETEQACHVSGCNGTLKALEKPIVQDDRTYIYQLGRSGGWICFQDEAEDIASELESEDLTIKERKEQEKNLQDAIKEINALKDYIKKYNDGLNWSDEVFLRMSEKLGDLEREESERLADIKNEKEAVKNKDITTLTLGALLSHNNEAVKRNAIGILKQLNKK